MLCAIQNFIKIPYVMLKLLLLYLYHEQDLHSDEMCYIKLVSHCVVFSAIEIESIATVISK